MKPHEHLCLGLVVVGVAAMLACATNGAPEGAGPDGAQLMEGAPPERFPHPKHTALFQCVVCHVAAEDGKRGMPKLEVQCVTCHDKKTEKNPKVRALLFEVLEPLPEAERFPVRTALIADVNFDHARHTDTAKIACQVCHQRIAVDGLAPVSFKMAACLACHAKAPAGSKAPTLAKGDESCASCHKETRRTAKPASHTPAPAWQREHGKQISGDWRKGEIGTCANCHTDVSYCQSCHEKTKAASHDVGWVARHGQVVSTSASFKETGCNTCHTTQNCRSCHISSEPRDHNTFFKTSGHGLGATIDRGRCAVCHRQDRCVRCHETQRPRSHTGGWGPSTERHCVNCHLPVAVSSCAACHKSTTAHISAPQRPSDARHLSGTTNCRGCHFLSGVAPHPDNGDDCRSCH